jgi:hypothetical protein
MDNNELPHWLILAIAYFVSLCVIVVLGALTVKFVKWIL